MSPVLTEAPPATKALPNSPKLVLSASLAGTTIEFFDFYIYATAAVLVFPELFFPESHGTAGTLKSLATFALAFFARPVGSALFGHFGDRVGRKTTLVAALLLMGGCTVIIGLLPTYHTIGIAAPILLSLCRIGQGLGLGGEWGGAVLLATENAPPGKRAWYGMFPQLGAPLGFIGSGGIFLILSMTLNDSQFLAWGWRLPFLLSSVLVVLGLWVRLRLAETPAFQMVLDRQDQVDIPLAHVMRRHSRELLLATLIAVATFVIFYLLAVFSLSWATTHMGYSRNEFLVAQLVGVMFFALTIPLSAIWAEKFGRRRTLILVSAAIAVFGLVLAPIFAPGTMTAALTFLILGFCLMGATYGPLGTMLAELFPARVRYTGASVAFNLAGILGGSLAPYSMVWLADHFQLPAVGVYLTVAALISLVALLFTQETRDTEH